MNPWGSGNIVKLIDGRKAVVLYWLYVADGGSESQRCMLQDVETKTVFLAIGPEIVGYKKPEAKRPWYEYLWKSLTRSK